MSESTASGIFEAVRSAQEGGIVGGGGTTLYRVSRCLGEDDNEYQSIADNYFEPLVKHLT